MGSNAIVITGARLTADPQDRLAGETPLVEITVVDNAWNEKRYRSKFVTCSFSGRMAEQARLLKKGDQVTVGGRLDYRTYEANDRTTRVAFEIQRPTIFEPHVDLRTRLPSGGDTAFPAADTSSGGKSGGDPPEPTAKPKNAWE